VRTILVVSFSLLAACGGTDATPDAGPPPRVDSGPPDAGPPPDDSPFKGPWAQRPTATAITIRWESQLAPPAVEIDVEPEGGGTMRTVTGTSRETTTTLTYGVGNPLIDLPDVPGTYFVNEVEIDGLDPATCYTYEIVGWPGEGGRFCTMHEATDHATPIRIYVLGDTAPGVMGTVRIMSATDPATQEFVLHVGDIQYYSTIVETQQLWFQLMAPMLRAGAFMPCIGNHEDEIANEYVDYYQRLFTPGGRDGNDRWYSYETGGVHFFSLSSEHDLSLGSEQIDWLEAAITAAEAQPGYRFSVLYLHRPVYSLGDYRPNESIRSGIFSVVAGHRVPLVLAGHVHAYERFEYPGVTYVTSGAGGFRDPSVDVNTALYPDDAMHRAAAGTFLQALLLEIAQDASGNDVIRGRAVDDMGIERDTFEHVLAP
jgi:hypothetical protein